MKYKNLQLSPSQLLVEKIILERLECLPRKVVVLGGKAGTGKTILVKNLSSKLEKAKYINCVEFSLKSDSSKYLSTSLLELIRKACDTYHDYEYLFLDNIDAIIYLEDKDEFISTLAAILRNYFGKKIVLVSTHICKYENNSIIERIPTDILVLLKFHPNDSRFLSEQIRGKLVTTDKLVNYYDGDI